MMLVTGSLVTEWSKIALVNVFGFAVLAGVASTVVAVAYRGASTRPVPFGVAVLVGLAVVGGWLNVGGLQGSTIGHETRLDHHATASYFLGSFLAGAIAAAGGRHVGDHIASEIFAIDRLSVTGAVASSVRASRRSIELELPATIAEADCHPSVGESVKRTLAGRTLLFPARLSVDDLESRLADRLERDYGLGYASVDVSPDGTVERLTVGDRRSGLDWTLPPETVAVAVRAEPPVDACVGDPVGVWDDSSRLVATGTVQSTTSDVVTVSVGNADAAAFDCGVESRYRLVVRPESPTAAPAFVAALRSGHGTIVSESVVSGSSLEDEFVGWIPGTVLAVVRDDEIRPFPGDEETLVAGDDLYVLGEPTALEEL
ncbi:cation:proton antiporter regulatory subunit [Natronobacterium gregoryi]|nr:hypothetical protein [Natronobacterium gregoryi]AFZ72542.1 hypothetical protein Natgr_1325 [Natronobacterium gregoryi SP2]PLK21510.1 hypothetical protein CYV19_04275 [Natronobacterium gregoryi SP2]SFI75919.1 hypothetical protein SAMN05443661_10516 [Natronobacterium gregoryi]